jgi:hypothetical protein
LNDFGASSVKPGNSPGRSRRALNGNGFGDAAATPDHVTISKNPTINAAARPHRRIMVKMLYLTPWEIKPSPANVLRRPR